MNASKDEHTYPPTHLHIQIGIHTHTHSLANAVAHTPIQKWAQLLTPVQARILKYAQASFLWLQGIMRVIGHIFPKGS